jgi:ankyrin repeat protein
MEIDGYAFCSGISALKPYEANQELQGLIRSVAYLIMGAVFRPRYETGRSGRFSLSIGPLSELVDMYHTRKATNPLDKVYALLGMSSDDPNAAKLSANYDTSWKEVIQKLVKFSLSDQMSVSAWDGEEVAVIQGKGYVLGEVSSVGRDTTRDDRQGVDITWESAMGSFYTKGKQSDHFTFQVSAKPIQVGDAVCLLEGASNPTIVRLRSDSAIIIMVAVPVSLTDDQRRRLASRTTVPHDFLLVWDWDESRRKSQGGEGYRDFVNNRGVPKCPRVECQCQDYLDKATRLWNFGLLLNGMERYKEAGKNLRNAVEAHRTGRALRSVDKTYPSHGPRREEDEEALRVMDDLLIDDKGAAMEAKYKEDGQTPLSWAAQNGHKAMMRLLIDKGANIEAKDEDGRTPLWWAARKGHEAMVRLLIDKGANIQGKNTHGQTPLWWAARNGHEAVVRLLVDKGANIETKNTHGQTPLWWAAQNGHEAVVRLLIDKGANIEAKDRDGLTPLSWAAENRHEAMVQLLVDKGASIEAKDKYGLTPLWWAARKGHEAVVRLLVDKGANIEAGDKDGLTPLSWATQNGHEAVVRLLVDKGHSQR